MARKFEKILSLVLVIALLLTQTPIPVNAGTAVSSIPDLSDIPVPAQTLTEPEIVGEVSDKRDANIKHFIREDLTYEAAIYPTAVHYWSDNAWQDIDNTLVEQSDAANHRFWQTARTPSTCFLPRTASQTGLSASLRMNTNFPGALTRPARPNRSLLRPKRMP